MPRIAAKAECLKGVVFCYSTDETKWYYREYNEQTQRYQYKLIKGVDTLDGALARAIDVFTVFRQEEVNPTPFSLDTTKRSDSPHSRLIEPLIEQYLKKEQERAGVGLIKQGTYETREVAVGIHLRNYFKDNVISRTHQIKLTTFDDYHVYRSQVTKLTRNKEVVEIRAFLSWLIRHEYLHPKLSKVNDLIKKERVTDEDLTSNPAINPDDWLLITKALRGYIRLGSKHSNPKTVYWRTLFHTFCLVLKNTGMRPVELRQLRWSDVEFNHLSSEEEEKRKHGEMSSTLTDKVASVVINVRKSKTHAQREVPAKVGRELRRWYDYLTEFIAKRREKSAVRIELTPESLVFGDCDREFKSYLECTYSKAWIEAVRIPLEGKLKGHRFSDKPYTIYSMRSTFIEDNLLQEGGCDIFLLARVCGHSVQVLQKHYERISIRSRSGELKQLPFGKKKEEKKDVGRLFN